ncbi:hypothetical protein BJP34_00175 [Moorena producens PAL-8-15-08-1]|uniref:Uncharacterized protein n=1 Tax=Moorena producens PAL-8-15-08-1 TaxID=1458985 RepID=A0A1D8TKE9_9CYAN|nr:hypothetical protein BJP34_00175 [Moorena producens PAL-8-15-08-1]
MLLESILYNYTKTIIKKLINFIYIYLGCNKRPKVLARYRFKVKMDTKLSIDIQKKHSLNYSEIT